MAKYVLMSVAQATHALDQARTRVTMATGHKVDFIAKVKLRPHLHGKRMILVLGSSERNMFSAFSLHPKGCIWP